MPGFTHLQSAQPVTFGHHLLAYVEMLGRDAGRLRRCAQAAQRKPARRRGARRHPLPDRPRHDGQGARLRPARRPTRSMPSPTATSSSKRSAPRSICAVHLSRFAEELVIWILGAVRLRAAQRQVHDRLLDHAAEAQPRRRRTGARQDRPHPRRADLADGGDEGPAADLFQGHAGGQGSRLRCARFPVALRSPR